MAQPTKDSAAGSAAESTKTTSEPTPVAPVATDTTPSTPILAAVAAAEAEPSPDVEVLTVEGDVYKTRGQYRVATTQGIEFHVPGAPPITDAGIFVTAEEADGLYGLAERYGVTLLVTSPSEQKGA